MAPISSHRGFLTDRARCRQGSRQGTEYRPAPTRVSCPSLTHDQCINVRRQEMLRGGVLLASIAFGLVGCSVAAQDRKGIRFWNLTLYTITSFQMSPAGEDSWGHDQCKNDPDGTVDHDESLRITRI